MTPHVSRVLLIVQLSILASITLQGTSKQNTEPIVGEWEGNFVEAGTPGQAVVWRFENGASGALVGFMGPIEAGAVLPMEKLAVDEKMLVFSLRGKGTYSGSISAESIRGTWTSSDASEGPAELNMTKVARQESVPREFHGSDRTWLGTESLLSSSVASGDFDGDGDIDLVVGNGRHWPQQNRVFLNSGGARYPRSFLLGNQLDTTYKVIAIDIDGDEDIDILVGNEDLENVVYLNDGMANFSLGSRFGEPGLGVRDLVAFDANRDGHPDVIELTRMGKNTLYLNDGEGRLRSAQSIGRPRDSIGAAAVGDLNGDEYPELVLADRDGGQDTVHFGVPGGFEAPLSFGRAIGKTHDVAIADMNGDGWMDIVTVSIEQRSQIHFGGPEQTFARSVEFGEEARSYAVAVGDIDQDGDIDLDVANFHELIGE